MPSRQWFLDEGAGRFRPRGPGAFLLGLMLLGAVPYNTFPFVATAQAESSPQPDAGPSPAALPAGTSTDWWAQAQRQVADAEYEVTWQERPQVAGLAPSWHAPNRAHGFRTYFTEGGLRVIPRQQDAPSWQWGLRLAGIGRGERVLPAGPAVLTPRANRMTYDRRSIVEWCVNDRRGPEQGMALSAAPGWTIPDCSFCSLVAQRRGAGQDFTKNGNACSQWGVLS
jgi:hypothetical protein